MPFILVHALPRSDEQKRRLIAEATEAVSAAYDCSPDITTTYITEYPEANYGHAGVQGAEADVRRVFVEIHALPRNLDQKRRLVKGITRAVVNAFEVSPDEVIVYIYDREKHEGAHGGVLISDSENDA